MSNVRLLRTDYRKKILTTILLAQYKLAVTTS